MEIKLYYKYLKYDIDQKTWRAANARLDEPGKRADAQSDSTDDDFYLRECEAAIARMLATLGTLNLDNARDSDDILDVNKKVWDITLSDSITTSARVLAELMHHFIVSSAMAKWAALYSPTEAATFANDSVDVLHTLEEALYTLSLPSKRRGHSCEGSTVADNGFVVVDDMDDIPGDDLVDIEDVTP